ncbi:hypothetical protein INT45_011752 [Circinella minor]|uniref:Cysteine-rich transmembrane domain-containing protein n=1 Tax=Circinella minor TaxID=1195481 RepID=A0A8H7SAY9_9FUNG|nr:hypothetical protein INT45_011752 [Circinella minor]
MGVPEQHKFRPTSAPVLPPPCYNEAQQHNVNSNHNTNYFQQPPPAYPGYHYNPASSSSSSYQPLGSNVQQGGKFFIIILLLIIMMIIKYKLEAYIFLIKQTPSRTDDACCWGCLAALCLCFAAEECC